LFLCTTADQLRTTRAEKTGHWTPRERFKISQSFDITGDQASFMQIWAKTCFCSYPHIPRLSVKTSTDRSSIHIADSDTSCNVAGVITPLVMRRSDRARSGKIGLAAEDVDTSTREDDEKHLGWTNHLGQRASPEDD